MTLSPNPFATGIESVARDVRLGKTTFLEITDICLQRIEALDSGLQAFELVCAERARAVADGFDRLLSAGTDLGPLMGMPVAIKDIIAVDGLPTTNGSLYQPPHLSVPQGAMVDRLLRLGCVVIGKTKTVEFALGATGVNRAKGTPWNAWDSNEHRIPGGSSSGSAVATHREFTGASVPPKLSVAGARLGIPCTANLDDLDAEVAIAFELARRKLAALGAQLVEIDVPENLERIEVFSPLVGAEIISSLTRKGFNSARDEMDPITAARAAIGLDVDAVAYLDAKKRHHELIKIGRQRMEGMDGWISPTCPMVPMTLESLDAPESAERSLLASRNTQMVNLFGQCAVTLPIHYLTENDKLPVGLQLIMNGGEDAQLLALAGALEESLGKGPAPDVTGFADAS